MDLNAKLHWKPGTKLTTEFLLTLSNDINRRFVTLTNLTNYGMVGLVAGTKCECNAVFSAGKLIVERLRCTAILANGMNVDPDERVEIDIPAVMPGDYYFCVGVSDKTIEFESKGLPYTRSAYKYAILSYGEVIAEEGLMLPLKKINVNGNRLTFCEEYIPPCLIAQSDQRIMQLIQRVIEKAHEILRHPNLPKEHFVPLASCVNRMAACTEFDVTIMSYMLLKEYMLHLQCHVLDNAPEDFTKMDMLLYTVDMETYYDFVDVLQDSAIAKLDVTPIVDDSIDLEKLKREIKEEVEAELTPKIHDSLYEELKTKITEELSEQFRQQIDDRISTEFAEAMERLRTELHDKLYGVLKEELEPALHDKLYPELYDELYQKLYDALFEALHIKQEEVEDLFMPDI
ncbi:MAG: hypothetical protein HUK08_01490 [Bacteroidaceae bacterium]|nr:hypothetical protein [Bacteroidaceae bacterium]